MAGRRLRVSGRLQVPGDKSISHRSLILSAVGTGTATVRDILPSADIQATARCLRALGWAVPELAPRMVIPGAGLRLRHPPATAPLDCANSGTTTRLMAGVAAAQTTESHFDGDASLRRRPMARIADPLRTMGASVEWEADAGRLPMRIRGGALRPIAWEPDVASAQVKSGILLAGLCAGVPVRVREPLPTRDHTELMLRSLGVDVALKDGWVSLDPTPAIPAMEWVVPGDPSSAAFFVALAVGAGTGSLVLEQVLLNPHRTGFLRVVDRMGATFDVHNESTDGGEEVGDIVAHASALRGTTVLPEEIPSLIDEVPILAVLAALAEGETVVQGAADLRSKESDRIATTVANLRACGVDAEELPEGLVVRGPARIRPASIVTGHDHRIAMAFGVLGRLAGVDLALDDSACVDVSFPTFWSDLASVCR
jgi:3-phosphoshikimate 1-carboxyvinyltransferase